MKNSNSIRFFLLFLFEIFGVLVFGQRQNVGEQKVARQPADTVAILGDTVELPCKVENQVYLIVFILLYI